MELTDEPKVVVVDIADYDFLDDTLPYKAKERVETILKRKLYDKGVNVKMIANLAYKSTREELKNNWSVNVTITYLSERERTIQLWEHLLNVKI